LLRIGTIVRDHEFDQRPDIESTFAVTAPRMRSFRLPSPHCVPHLAGAERMVHRGCGLEIVVGQGGGVRRNLLTDVELLHELVPRASTLALLINPTNPVTGDSELRSVQTAALVLGLDLVVVSLITSAPRSASNRVQNGAATKCPISRTRKPVKGP
jgi:hypothetical protein